MDGDAFGHDVNIAARGQSYAPPGGVALTQVALTELNESLEIGYSSIGHKRFKNIPESIELFSLEMPWSDDFEEERRGVFINLETIKELLTSDGYKIGRSNIFDAVLTVGILLLITGVVYGMYVTTRIDMQAGKYFRMEDDWNFLVTDSDIDVDQVMQITKGWGSIDITKTWSKPDELFGHYWLKKEFKISSQELSDTPSLILGLVSKSHEVYLNGNFIGGSDKFSELVSYSFDTSLIDTSGENLLLVKGFSKKTLSPGLRYLPEIGSYIGDYRLVRSAIRSNNLNFHVMRYMYLSISFLFMMISMFYYLFYTHKKHLRYFSLYFMLGGILVLYYTPLISDNLPYYWMRYMKVASVSLSGFVIFSCYLYLIGRPRLERANNLAAFFALGVISVMLLNEGESMGQYAAKYDFVLRVGSYISLSMLVYMFWVSTTEAIQVFSRKRLYTYESVYASACLVASIFICVFIFSATHDGFVIEVSRSVRRTLGNFSAFFPIVLTPVLVVMVVLEHSLDNLKFRRSLAKDRLLLDIGREFRECRDVELIIEYTLDKICKFIGVSRATVYIKDGAKDGFLTARCKFGSDEKTDLVRYEISERDGVIGYVFRTGELLVIDDINADPRFKSVYKNRPTVKYNTGTCMIVPLVYLGDLVGVMTIADKKNGRTFSSSDVRLMLSIAKDLGLMIGTSPEIYKSGEPEYQLSS